MTLSDLQLPIETSKYVLGVNTDADMVDVLTKVVQYCGEVFKSTDNFVLCKVGLGCRSDYHAECDCPQGSKILSCHVLTFPGQKT